MYLKNVWPPYNHRNHVNSCQSTQNFCQVIKIGKNTVNQNNNKKLMKQVNRDIQWMIILILAIFVSFQVFFLIKNIFFHFDCLFEVLLNSIKSFGTKNDGDKEKHNQTYCKRCLRVIIKIWIPSLWQFIQQHWENGNVKKWKNVRKDEVSIN